MSYSASGASSRRKGIRSLIVVAVVCALPVVASYFMFYFWRPSGSTNYGEILQVKPLPDPGLRTLDGNPFRLADLRGRWVMLTVDRGSCAAPCQEKLFKMRQLRLMQGKDMDRIERVWLVTDGVSPDAKLADLHRGMWMIDARAGDLIDALPVQVDPSDHIYLIDPLGNLMMRYGRDADPARMKKDFERLLKVSRVG